MLPRKGIILTLALTLTTSPTLTFVLTLIFDVILIFALKLTAAQKCHARKCGARKYRVTTKLKSISEYDRTILLRPLTREVPQVINAD